MPRRVLWAAAALFPLAIWAAARPAVAAPPDKVLLTYRGKPVTCRDLTLLTWPQMQRRLSRIARYVKRPPGGDWPRVQAMLFPVRGPILYYRPPQGTSVAEALRGMCHSYIQSAVDSYLAGRVVLNFAKRHPFDYRKHFHPSKLHAYNLAYARAWDAYNLVYAQCVEKGWTATQLKAAMQAALPGEPVSRLAEWATGSMPEVKRHPVVQLMGALFPCERHGVVAPWCRITVPDICFRFPMRAAIRAGKAKYALTVARLYGTSGFVFIRHLLPQDEGEVVRIIHACTGPHGRIDKLRLALIQIYLWLVGSPTRIDPGFGGNYFYFSTLTGKPAKAISPETFVPVKKRRHSFIYIYQRHPTVNKLLDVMKPGFFLWGVGEDHLLKPAAKRVLAGTRSMVPWLALPAVTKLVTWSYASDGLPGTRIFGFPLPQLVRKKYRQEKW